MPETTPRKRPTPRIDGPRPKNPQYQRVEYRESSVPEGTAIQVPKGADIQVLEVRPFEGQGMGERHLHFKYVLIWR